MFQENDLLKLIQKKNLVLEFKSGKATSRVFRLFNCRFFAWNWGKKKDKVGMCIFVSPF